MTADANLRCPVCASARDEPPWAGDRASLEICSSCGLQFGYTDMAGGDLTRRERVWKRWREAWIKNGKQPLPKQFQRDQNETAIWLQSANSNVRLVSATGYHQTTADRKRSVGSHRQQRGRT